MKIEVKETSKEDAKREEEWKVEEAMHTLMEYQKILEDKELNFCKNEQLKSAYLVGAFLSGGSISDISKPFYHLEIRSTNPKYLRFIQQILIS